MARERLKLHRLGCPLLAIITHTLWQAFIQDTNILMIFVHSQQSTHVPHTQASWSPNFQSCLLQVTDKVNPSENMGYSPCVVYNLTSDLCSFQANCTTMVTTQPGAVLQVFSPQKWQLPPCCPQGHPEAVTHCSCPLSEGACALCRNYCIKS